MISIILKLTSKAKRVFPLLLLPMLFGGCNSLSEPETTALFLIREHQRYGFMDQHGTVVIPPKFHNAKPFANGLAPARENAYFGYINTQGEWVLPPVYAAAESFQSGWATVSDGSKEYYINVRGDTLDTNFIEVQEFKDGFANVVVRSGKLGRINQTGTLVIDTLYDDLGPFYRGITCGGFKNDTGGRHYAILDTTGQVAPQFNEFKWVNPFYGPIAFAKEKRSNKIFAVNRYGEKRFQLDTENYITFQLYEQGDEEGRIALTVSHEKIEDSNTFPTIYIFDTLGRQIHKSEIWYDISSFCDRTALVWDKEYRYWLVDKGGVLRHSQPIFNICNTHDDFNHRTAFEDGLGCYEFEEGWTVIDTGLHALHPPRNFSTKYLDRRGNIVIVDYFDSASFWNIRTDSLSKKSYQHLNFDRSADNIFYALVDKRPAYYDLEENLLWQEPLDSSLLPLNLDYMMTLSLYFKSEILPPRTWQEIGNPSRLHYYDSLPPSYPEEKTVSVEIDTDSILTFQERFEGYPLQLRNATSDSVLMYGDVSCMLQALDSNHQWQDILYTYKTGCGNMSPPFKFPNGSCVDFVIPKFTGAYNTQVRACIYTYADANAKEMTAIYSNAVPMSINWGQFFQAPDYDYYDIHQLYWEHLSRN